MSLAPKILIIYAHPEPTESVANKMLIEYVQDLDNVVIHELYGTYPDYFINASYERKLLCQHEIIIFQHPLYTYSCPSLLKEWFDRVLTRNFVCEQSKQLKGKYWRSVITTGEPQEAYQYGGYNRFPLTELLRPFELIALMCEMQWLSPVIIYMARRQSLEYMQECAKAYRDWLKSPLEHGGL
uniref:General stress protein 14 n=1 Tax=Arsenophonus endosymbiont of Trialeurodes vaporariorum TaxID=235567 RepID=A0A3B0LZ40_9GAMM